MIQNNALRCACRTGSIDKTERISVYKFRSFVSKFVYVIVNGIQIERIDQNNRKFNTIDNLLILAARDNHKRLNKLENIRQTLNRSLYIEIHERIARIHNAEISNNSIDLFWKKNSYGFIN